MITFTAFRSVPPFARGLGRDLRIRWALEEAGLPYEAQLVTPEDRATAQYRARQPFGLIPAYEEDGLRLFESGAILLHLGERSETLLPRDPAGRARATAWLFAAVNTVEPVFQRLTELDLFPGDEADKARRRPAVEALVRRRLGEVAAALGDQDHLEGCFTVGDLTMATVLRMLRHTSLVAQVPALAAYHARCEARPAFQRALKGQMQAFEG